MKSDTTIIRNTILFFAAAFVFCGPRASAQTTPQSAATVSQAPFVPARITKAIDETQRAIAEGKRSSTGAAGI